MVNAVKSRRLSDLYRRGIDMTIGDEEGEGVRVWLQKLNPVENEHAVRAANAVRARSLLKKRQTDSEDYLATVNDVLDYSFDDLVEYLSTYKVASEAEAFEAEYAEEKEWTKDDYLQGLRDSWEDGGLKERYFAQDKAKELVDADAQTCFEEMERFTKGVEERLQAERSAVAKDYVTLPEEELRQMVTDQLFKMQADMNWLLEYRKMELYLGVRDPDNHRETYFENRDEVDELEIEVITRLIDQYADLNVGVTEGKDSPETADSSSVSKPLSIVEADSSGPKEPPQ